MPGKIKDHETRITAMEDLLDELAGRTEERS